MRQQMIAPFTLVFLLAVSAAQAQRRASLCTLQTHSGDLFAHCSGLQLTSVPTSLPPSVSVLDLGQNKLTFVQNLSFVRFRNLRTLDLGFNELVRIESNAFIGLTGLETLRIAHNHISFVGKNRENTTQGSPQGSSLCSPDSCGEAATTRQHTASRDSSAQDGRLHNNTRTALFSDLRSLRVLDLSHNRIHAVSVDTFVGLSNLTLLNLSGNTLESVAHDCFSDLTALVTLDLSNNRIRSLSAGALAGLDSLQTLALNGNRLGDASLPDDVFQPVASTLKFLAVEHNNFARLPEKALSRLRSLEDLSTDVSYHTQFGAGFRTMTALSTLTVPDSHSCKLSRLTNDTFDNLTDTNLTSLILNHCNDLVLLQACAFCHLRHLTHLSLRRSEMVGIPQALRSLYGTVGRNMSVIDFSGIARGRRWQGRKGSVLDPSNTGYLLQTCVSTLILSDNDIFAIRPHALTRQGALFHRCLRSIDLSRNYLLSVGFFELFRFGTLTTRLKSFQGQEQKFYSITEAQDVLHLKQEEKHEHFFKLLGLNLPFPPEMELMNISASCYEVGPVPARLHVNQPNSLRVLDMSYVQIQNCMFMLYGLSQLQSLNMSRNNCRGLQPSFFDYLPSLTELSLQDSNLARFFLARHTDRVFRNLSRLQRLDLSFNDLDLSLTELLTAQHDLRELRLAGNRFAHVPLELGQHWNLSVLDLSNNVITQLEAEDREAIDRLASSRTGPFSLHLRDNPLACTCDTLPFIRWLGETPAHLDLAGNYTCVSDDGTLRNTLAMMEDVESVWRACVGPPLLLGSLLGVLSLLSLLGGAWAVSVNATRIRFWWKVFRQIQMPRRHFFQEDAYLAYCDADAELACVRLKGVLQDQRGVRLLIRDLPVDQSATSWWLLPGDNAAEKMLEHMDVCWKVVLVLTQALPHDPLAGFMTRAALQSVTDSMPDRVVLLCVGVRHVPPLASLRALLKTVPERQVFFVPAGAGDEHPVWDALAETILGQ